MLAAQVAAAEPPCAAALPPTCSKAHETCRPPGASNPTRLDGKPATHQAVEGDSGEVGPHPSFAAQRQEEAHPLLILFAVRKACHGLQAAGAAPGARSQQGGLEGTCALPGLQGAGGEPQPSTPPNGWQGLLAGPQLAKQRAHSAAWEQSQEQLTSPSRLRRPVSMMSPSHSCFTRSSSLWATCAAHKSWKKGP